MARKILLADDSVTAQNMGRKILTDAGYDVITVNNGSAALKRVAELKPDLIVLDVYMPGYSGLEVCARLKDAPDTARIPILLTVGKLEPFKPEEATRVRADGFIVKPFEASELLSALTRLEDRMVPSQSDGSRFSTSVSGIERFSGDPMTKKSGGDESDTGWKNRLRLPSKKKKEEPEPEPEPDFVTPSSFREFRRGAGKAPAGTTPFPLSATPPAAQEPGLVPDIPRDITPEELDALSDLVAKLDGPAAAAENVAPISEKIGPVDAPVPEAKSEVVAPSEPAELKKEAEIAPAVALETQTTATSTDTSPAPAAVETTPAEAAVAAVVAEEKAIAQQPAPVEKGDEPTFASAAIAPEAPRVENSEVQAQSAAAGELNVPVAEPAPETAPHAEEPKREEAPKAKEISQAAPAAASSPETTGGEPSPSAEELAEALRFLTPSQTPGATQTLAEAGAALADELSRKQGGGSRWVAEAVALSPEEVSGSLEAEMLRTFGGSTGGQTPGNGASATVPDRKPGVATTETAAEKGSEARAFTQAEESLAAAMAASALASERAEPQQKDSQAEESSDEEIAATTFADAIRREETEDVAASAQTGSSVSAEAPAREEVSNSEDGPGGQEAMGKETKGKGEKSNWHQMRSAAPAPGSDAVEAAKQSEEPAKAKAATAAAEGGSDPNSIASIVDSVLADLRPKIVEEIAKKLAKK